MNILSWGAGLQSTVLLEMSANGELEKLDYAIFANTGFEKDDTLKFFDFYRERAARAGIQVIEVSHQDIYTDHFEHRSAPLYVENTGRQLQRQCTRDYKITPIQRKIRELAGMNQLGRTPSDKVGGVELWLGITIDEIERMGLSRVKYIKHRFPFLELKWARYRCTEYLRDRGLPIPVKSSCKFCPYQRLTEWQALSEEDREKIIDLEQHINRNGLVKINGIAKRISFLPIGNLNGVLGVGYQPGLFDGCDSGFCNL